MNNQRNRKIIYATLVVALVLVVAVCLFLLVLHSNRHTEEPAQPTSGPVLDEESGIVTQEDGTQVPIGDLIEDASVVIEEAVNETVTYDNSKVYYFPLADGSTLTIGLGNDASDAIYINSNIEPVEGDATKYIIFLSCDEGEIIYESDQYANQATSTQRVFYGLKQTYDMAIEAPFRSMSLFGAKWQPVNEVVASLQSTSLSMRVIRMLDDRLINVLRVPLEYNAKTHVYSLGEPVNSDVSSTMDLTQAERDELVDMTIRFLVNPDLGPNIPDSALEFTNGMRRGAIVEHTHALYNRRIITPDNTGVIKYGQVYGKDIYAVTVPEASSHYYTCYFISEMQLTGLNTRPENKMDDMILLGYDALYPASVSSLHVPSAIRNEFFASQNQTAITNNSLY